MTMESPLRNTKLSETHFILIPTTRGCKLGLCPILHFYPARMHKG